MEFQRAKRSPIWDHFERQDGKAKCKLCLNAYAYHGGTTNLREHLRRCHPETQPKQNASQNSDNTSAGTKRINSFAVSTTEKKCSPLRSKQITELAADWVSENMRPLSIICDSGFCQLMEFVEPGYAVPSRTLMTNTLKARYKDCRKELAELLNRQDAVAVTTDGWTSKAVESYITYSAHFVGDNWSLVTCVLETSKFHGSHTAVRLAEHAVSTVEHVNMPLTKIVGVVHDEAANMMTAGRILEEDHDWASLS